MNRNVESHFSELPKVDIQRSIFDRSSSHKTSFNVGELIPFYIDEVLPGDTFKVTTSAIVRLQTPLTPIMDNIYMDTYFFFVPNRIIWEHWKNFMGENTSSEWLPSATYAIPKINPPSGGWNVGTIADYLGIPVGVGGSTNYVKPSHLPFRAYCAIANEFFRDQNLTKPIIYSKGDSQTQGTNGTNYITDTQCGGAPFKVSKYHDYFTSCLPAPQKGPSVPIIGHYDFTSSYNNYTGSMVSNSIYAPVFARSGNDIPNSYIGTNIYFKSSSSDTTGKPLNNNGSDDAVFGSGTGYTKASPINLWADLSNLNSSINDLRIAFQLQKFYEKNARAGTRYREILKEHFGVTSSDARMQIPEYLGGHRFPLSIHQVANQSQGATDFLGDLGAMSNTSDIHEDFVKSFEEHGYVLGLACVRYDHSYPQGLEKFWRRSLNTDFYMPVFANIGEQAVYKSEVYYDPTSSTDDVFGYQEAWADYRYKPSRVSGEMRPGVTNSLATWHLADYYNAAPTLSDSWIREDKSNIDRVLSVQSSAANQVFCDFYVKNIATRPMPVYSIPGLADHH